jgi:hypothetical protein
MRREMAKRPTGAPTAPPWGKAYVLTRAVVKGFVVGLVLFPLLVIFILSIRPGGLRRQLRHAARRLRLALILGGVYVVGSGLIRVFFPQGPVAEWGPAVIALVAGAVFVVLAQDPRTPAEH